MTAETARQPLSIDALAGVIPAGRVGHFMRAAGFDPVRAAALHAWNEEVGAAFFGPLQKVELALRTKVESAFADVFGPCWFASPAFLAISDHADRRSLAEVRNRLVANDVPIDAQGVMAKASMGLWVGLLRPVYNPPVWSGRLRFVFPHLPAEQGRHELALLASRAAVLRNRVDHHEPLIEMDLSRSHADVMRLLRWIDPSLASRAGNSAAVPRLLRVKP